MALKSIVVYGHSGSGKTTSVGQVMHKGLWVVTRDGNLDSYHSWLAHDPKAAEEYGCTPVPDNHTFLVKSRDINVDTGEFEAVQQKDLLDGIVKSYCLKVVQGASPWQGIVFDEFSEFADRVYRELAASSRDGFAVIRKFKEWIANICEIPSITGQPMVLICHAQDPKYHEEGRQAGKLKYKGGPAMPIGTIIEPLCARADAVLRLEVEADLDGKIKRSYATTIHPDWEGKCRLWGAGDKIALDLRTLLQQAGW